jgi:hypothetical protein
VAAAAVSDAATAVDATLLVTRLAVTLFFRIACKPKTYHEIK